MAYKKKIENETPEEMHRRLLFEIISNQSNRPEKTSWKRKQKKLEKIIDEKVRPLEDEILTLMNQKAEIMDEVEALRLDMVKDCIHPYELLSYDKDDDTVSCKFCNRRMRPVVKKDDEEN